MYNSLNSTSFSQVSSPTTATIVARYARVLCPNEQPIDLAIGETVTVLCRVPRHRLYVKVQTAGGQAGYLFVGHMASAK